MSGIIGHIEINQIPQEYRGHSIIIWDGDCGFCRRSVEWVKLHDKKSVLMATPYQKNRSWLPSHIWELSQKQVHLITPNGEIWGGGDAVSLILDLIDYEKLSLFLGFAPARFFTNWGYRLVARNRLLFSKLFFRK